MKSYSPYFKTLHDEAGPTGYLGRGTHYSVLRTVTWFDASLRRLDAGQYCDLAVIWDEDHDERIIPVIEHLNLKGLLSPLLFIGERKGHVTLVTGKEMPQAFRAACNDEIRIASEAAGDPWEPLIAVMGADVGSIISAQLDEVQLYLKAINMLWRLGPKPVPSRVPDPQS